MSGLRLSIPSVSIFAAVCNSQQVTYFKVPIKPQYGMAGYMVAGHCDLISGCVLRINAKVPQHKKAAE